VSKSVNGRAKGHYMEDECTYYHEQAIILRSEEVENQVEEEGGAN
jgi:hypothetical protein